MNSRTVKPWTPVAPATGALQHSQQEIIQVHGQKLFSSLSFVAFQTHSRQFLHFESNCDKSIPRQNVGRWF